MPEDVVDLDPEDAKLIVLARATRARTSASAGAAVRDNTGRTYAAAAVSLPSLTLTALQAAVVIAVASGATSLESAAVVSESAVADDVSLAAVKDLAGPRTLVFLADLDGELVGVAQTCPPT